MSDCENVWLAIRIASWTLFYSVCAATIYHFGYWYGRRVEAEAREEKIDYRTMQCKHEANVECDLCRPLR